MFVTTGLPTLSYFEDVSASGGLQSERDAEIEQNSRLWMGTT